MAAGDMTWVGWLAVGLAFGWLVTIAVVAGAVLFTTRPSRRDQTAAEPPRAAPPPSRPRQPSRRLELPAGEESHLEIAQALHEATGMNLEWCGEQVRRVR